MRLVNRRTSFSSIALLVLGTSFALPSFAQVRIEKPWARATVAGASVGGGYFTVINGGAATDRLVGASSPVAARTEIHEMAMEKDIMRMREVRSVDVPARGKVEFRPGGYHLMFQQLKAPFKEGDKVPVTLRFEKAGDIKAELEVGSLGAAAASKMDHGGMKH